MLLQIILLKVRSQKQQGEQTITTITYLIISKVVHS